MFTPKSAARVLTIEESRWQINEKERKKQKHLKRKRKGSLREKGKEEKKKMMKTRMENKESFILCTLGSSRFATL